MGHPCLTPRPILPDLNLHPLSAPLPLASCTDPATISYPSNQCATFSLYYYLKHSNPFHSVERFLEINKADIHFIPTFQTSLTQSPHHSNCISCPTTFPEPKLIPSQQMFCFRLYSLSQHF